MYHKVPPWDHFFFLFLLTTYLKYAQIVLFIFMLMTLLFTLLTDILQIQNSLQLILTWSKTGFITTNSYWIGRSTRHSHSYPFDLHVIFDDGSPLEKVDSFKYLGLWIDPELSSKPHIDFIIKRTYGCLSSVYRSINYFTFQARKRIISQLILPIIDYADIVYQNTSDTYLTPLNVVYNSLCRFALRCPYRTHHGFMYESLNWLQPKFRRQFHWAQFIFKCVYFNCPSYLEHLLVSCRSSYPLRHFLGPQNFQRSGRRLFQYKAPSDWNNLPLFLRSITSFRCFRTSLFSHLKTTCLCF